MSSTNPTRRTEDMGPYEHECPEAILDLLTPTDNAYDKNGAARANAVARRARSAEPAPWADHPVERPLNFKTASSRPLHRRRSSAQPPSRYRAAMAVFIASPCESSPTR